MGGNNLKNKLIIIAMLFCVLLTLSAVSASDIANDDNAVQVSSEDNMELSTAETVNEDTNVVEDVVGETIDPQATEIEETLNANNDNGEKIGEDAGQYNTTDVNNYAELSGLFASGKMGRTSQNLTVNLLGDEEYTVTKEIAIQTVNTDKLRNLIINGNGRVINGNDAYRFIRVGTYKGGVNLTINNLTIKNCYNNLKATKIGNNIINNHSIKTNINSPIGSDREEKQIINLNHELTNKKNEINKLKERINEQNKYIIELEEKIKSIIDEKMKEDIDYEQYSKKMIVRNIKVLTSENEELHKQIDEYKEKEMKIMKALYYLNKQGISIDSFLGNNNNENKN